MSTTVSATQGSVAVGSIQVGGDVNGDIIIGHHNFKVNTNYGTIVYNASAEPVIKRRDAKPQPPRGPTASLRASITARGRRAENNSPSLRRMPCR